MDVRQVLRRGNLLIARAAEGEPDGAVRFICECASDDCLAEILLSPAEFQVLSQVPGRFVLLQGHEEPGEEVVGEGPGYRIVEIRSGAYPERTLSAG